MTLRCTRHWSAGAGGSSHAHKAKHRDTQGNHRRQEGRERHRNMGKAGVEVRTMTVSLILIN